MQALRHRQPFRVDDRLEAEAGHDPGKLVALRSGAGGHVGADHPDVCQIGMRLKVACKLLQRNRDRVLHLPRPGDRCSVLRHRGHMLVPEMQSHDPLAPLQARAVVQGETLGRTGDIDAENADRVAGVFEHRVAALQASIKCKKEVRQPRMAVRLLQRWPGGIPHRHERVPAVLPPILGNLRTPRKLPRTVTI